jgi:hypothetical protein
MGNGQVSIGKESVKCIIRMGNVVAALQLIADLPVLVLNLYPIGEKTSTTPTLLVIYCAESAGE